MTAEVSRDEFNEYREQHHAAMNTIAKSSEAVSLKVIQIYDMLAGTFERPGMVHRLSDLEKGQAALDARQSAHERGTPEEKRAQWWSDRGTKIVDAVLVTVVAGGLLTLILLGVRGFIRDSVRDLSSVQAPRGTMIPVERDPSTRFALNQEF